MVEWLAKPLLLGRHLADMKRMETYLKEECADIEYTVVKPPGLQDRPDKPGEFVVHVKYATHKGCGGSRVSLVVTFPFVQDNALFNQQILKLCVLPQDPHPFIKGLDPVKHGARHGKLVAQNFREYISKTTTYPRLLGLKVDVTKVFL